MKLTVLSFAAAVLLLSGCASNSTHTLPPTAPKAQTQGPPPLSASGEYGESFDASKAVPVAKALPTPKQAKKNKDKVVVVRADVTEVCPKKGCWMKVKGNDQPIRVAFKDYGFFVPTELVGRQIAMQGHFIVHTETVAEQKHLLEDAKAPKSEIDAITKDKETLRFIATGVRDLTVTK